MLCQCPLNKSLPDIPEEGCPENFGQIQKVIFQRILYSQFRGTLPVNPKGIGGRSVYEAWLSQLSEKDQKQIVISPYIQGITMEGGDAVTYGGGNESINGIAEIVRTNHSTMSGALRSITQDVARILKKYSCYAEVGNLGIYFLNGNNQVVGRKSIYENFIEPIPLKTLFIGDKKIGGLDEPDSNVISWTLGEDWSNDIETYTLDFDPTTAFIDKAIPLEANVSEINEGSPASEQPTEGVGGEPRRKTAENK